jgi:hypothetical protein
MKCAIPDLHSSLQLADDRAFRYSMAMDIRVTVDTKVEHIKKQVRKLMMRLENNEELYVLKK